MSLSSLRNRASAQSGFSLIELLVVVLIIGILAAIMIPRFLGQRDNANNSQAQTAVRNAVSAAEAYYQKNGEEFPGTDGPNASSKLSEAITTSEPNLDVEGGATPASPNGAAGASATAGSNAAVPTNIWLVVSEEGRNGSATLCAAGKGDHAYCMQISGEAATKYGKGDDVDEAFDTLAEGSDNWKG